MDIFWGWHNLRENKGQFKPYLSLAVFIAVIPFDEIILALGGIVIILATSLIILKTARKKRTQHKLNRRVIGIKKQFNELKDESINYGDDDWIEMRLKENSDKYKQQLGMNKK